MKQLLFSFEPSPSAKTRQQRPMFRCIYCGVFPETRDHVPPKALLEEPWPKNYRKVPACRKCNAAWSLDEQYFSVVLGSISPHPKLVTNIEPGGEIDRALSASPYLDDRIINALIPEEDGSIILEIEIDRITRITTKIAYGLYCLNYGVGASFEDFSTGWAGPEQELPRQLVAAQWGASGIRRKRWTIIQEGVFRFLFTKGKMASDPPLYCMMDFYETIFAVVWCPPSVGRGKKFRLRAKPWV